MMKKNYIQPATKFTAMAVAEDYLTTSVPITDENVDDSGKAKDNFFDDEDLVVPVSVWDK